MKISNPRTSSISKIIAERLKIVNPRILVVGCGSGKEAAVLACDLNAEVIGVDILEQFDANSANFAKLQQGDATALEFEDSSFDIVFSYHALEHIPNYHKALSEMKRVLKENGIYCIGTPNRSRLLGYIGGNSSIRQKIIWNLNDLKFRLMGRFKNEYGAHAGYTSRELEKILDWHFELVEDVSGIYYERLYFNWPGVVKFLIDTKMCKLIFPSIYFVGKK